MKYSFIIPVYNVEKYLEECLESILKQKYTNYEIILINDCSTDKSSLICEKYNKKYSFIKYINNKQNKGISKVRNQGLKLATKDYIIFIDSDDFYNQDFLIEANKILTKKKYDVLISKFIIKKDYSEAREVTDIEFDAKRINDKTHEEILEYIYIKRMINTVWRFIIKRSTITNNNIYFIDNIIHEDEEWVPKLLCKAKTIYYFDKQYYTYRIREHSITNTPNLYNYECYLKIANLLCNYAKKEKINYKKKFYLRSAYKNCFQAYLGIRKLAIPLKMEHDEKKHYLKPNIIIYGPSRIGKTTLAKKIAENFNYNVVSIDKLVASFDNIFPKLNINHSDRSGYSQKKMSAFSLDYFNNLSSYSSRINNMNYVMEGCYLDIKEVYKKVDHKKTIIIVLLTNLTSKKIERNLNRYDKYYDWTYNCTAKEKKSYAKNIYNNNKVIKETCKKNNIKYWEIADNREIVFLEIIKYLEQEIKNKTKIIVDDIKITNEEKI